MSEVADQDRTLRFDGRVAIVTGAGGNPGLGRSHAKLLASRGAKVVVNDLGVGPDGSGRQKASAEEIVDEIRAEGGEAVADLHSVADEDSAKAIVQTALDTWGRVDVLINNAGVGVVAEFDVITSNDINRLIGVHLMGHLWMCRAAWPHMIRAGYGRIVNTTSGGMFGMKGLAVYAAAKMGIYGLTRGLSVEGAEHGIRVNALSPGAATRSGPRFFRMADPRAQDAYDAQFTTERVSPGVVYLAHEDCSVSGVLLDAGGGNLSGRMIAATPGIDKLDMTIEDVHANIDLILNETTTSVITRPLKPAAHGMSSVADFLIPTPYEPT